MAVIIPQATTRNNNVVVPERETTSNVRIPGSTDIINKKPSRFKEFGKDLIRGIIKPVVKSFLAPGTLVETLRTGREVKDLKLPFLGDVTPPSTIRGAFGTGLETALLAVGGATLKGTGKQLLKTVGKEALIGGGFGLGVGLSEEKKGKDLISPTLLGASLGAVAPLGVKVAQQAGRKAIIQPLKKIGPPVKKLMANLAKSEPVKFVSSVRSRLQQLGDPGEKILAGFEKIDEEKLLRSGAAIDDLNQAGFRDLTKEDSRILLDLLEGRKTETPANLKPLFETADRIRQEIAGIAQQEKLQVKTDFFNSRPFHPRKNFFPHLVPDAKSLKKGKFRTEVVEDTVRRGTFNTVEEAEKVLDSYVAFAEAGGKRGSGKDWIDFLVFTKQAKTFKEAEDLARFTLKAPRLKKFGPLEQARILDFPFYDPDPQRVLPKYILGAFERLETVKQFGDKSQKLNAQLSRIARLQGEDAGQEARMLLDQATGAIDKAPAAEKLSLFLRGIQIPKLAFAQIINIGQPIVNGILKADAPSVAFGLSKAFTKIGRQKALRGGSTLDSTVREVTNKLASDSQFANKFLKWTGFSASEKFNRVVSHNTGMRYLQRTVEQLQKNPASKVLRSRIKELQLDPDILLKEVTEKDLLKAGQKFTNITQFRGRPIDLPAFVNSPMGKVAFQFKTFAFSQSRLIKDTLKTDLINRNYTGALKTLFVLGTVFPMTGEVLQDVRALVTRSNRPTKALDRYFDNIVSAGGLGIASDLWSSAEFGSLAESLLGPTASTATKGAENIIKSINKGEVTDSTIKFLMDQFGVLRPLKNTIFPPRER